MSCTQARQVHRYHDDELSADERASVEAHLATCSDCRNLLADLRRLSSMIFTAPQTPLPVDALSRLQDTWRHARERSVIRLAGWLTAAAAAVLVVAVASEPREHKNVVRAQPGVWQTLAATPPSEAREDGNEDLLVLAQWLADELSPVQQR